LAGLFFGSSHHSGKLQELPVDLVVWWCTRSPVGAAEGCDLLIFSNLQIAKARSKDRSLRQLLQMLRKVSFLPEVLV
jgi:hypothetical protein